MGLSDGDGSDSLAMPRLLAVDAGVRAGIAVYRGDGRLESYRSTNFGSVKRLKSGVYAVMRDIEELSRLVVEGAGGGIAEPWRKEAARRGLTHSQIQANRWREELLLPRDRRSGVDAKEQADTLARRVIEWSAATRPTSLRHDAAEAIMIGLWGVIDAGWLRENPIRRG